ncbi:MAG: cation:proton antiporter [Anaerolineae bacterium]|nr:cation:proton antiporter [Anaerolineae bacterium]
MGHGGSSPLVPLLLVTGLAVTVPLIAARFRRIRVPVVVLEILAGIVIGRSGLNIVGYQPTLDFLAEFGFAFLMFLAGLEVDFSLILPRAEESKEREPFYRNATFLGAVLLALTVLLAGAGGFGLVAMGVARSGPLIALILSTTSLGIVVPVLKERGLLVSEFGQALLVAALLADFVTLILIGVVVAFYEKGLSLDLLVVLLLAVVFAALFRVGKLLKRWNIRERIARLVSDSTQIAVRLALALLVGWEVLAESLGLEIILGAFLAGALISLLSSKGDEILREKLDAMGYGFFIPIFFISVGMNFDLGALFASPTALALVPLLIVLAYLVKMVPALLYRLRFSWREAISAGALLSSRLSLIIAASAIALELELVTSATNSAIILLAIVTCTLSPFIFNRVAPQPEAKARQGTILAGAGDLAGLLAQRLARRGRTDLALVGDCSGRITQALDSCVLQVDAALDRRSLKAAGAETAEALVAVDTDEETNVRVARLARETFGIPNVIAVVSSQERFSELHALGARWVQPSMALLLSVEGALEFPAAFDLLTRMRGIEIHEARLANSRLVGQALRDAHLPGGVLVMGIRRDNEIIVPHGDTRLQFNDVLLLVAPEEEFDDVFAWLEQKDVT